MIDKNSQIFKDLVEKIKNCFDIEGEKLCCLAIHSKLRSQEGIEYTCNMWLDCKKCSHRIMDLDKLKKEITKDISNKNEGFEYLFIRRKFQNWNSSSSVRFSPCSKIAEYILEMTEEDLEEKEEEKPENIVKDLNAITSSFTGYANTQESIDAINNTIRQSSIGQALTGWVSTESNTLRWIDWAHRELTM